MAKKHIFKHLAEVNESYCQHFWVAFSSACLFMIAAVFIIIHAVFPPVFVDHGSRLVQKTLDRIKNRKLQG